MDELTVAVMTTPTPVGDEPFLTREVELVRSALLYADRVDLVSLNALVLAGALPAGTGRAGLMAVIASLDDETLTALGAEPSEGWREELQAFGPVISAMSRLSPEVLRQLPRQLAQDPAFEGVDPALWEALAEAVAQLGLVFDELDAELGDNGVAGLLESSGGADLLPVMDAGILRVLDYTAHRGAVHPLVESTGHAGRGFEEVLSEWATLLADLLMESDVRLLLDDSTAAIAQSLIQRGVVTPTDTVMRRAGQAAIGSGLVARLPAFPHTPTDELLELRGDLQGALVRYRAAVARMAQFVSDTPFHSDASRVIDDLWITEVQPALLEIRESLAEHTLVRELARTVSGGVGALVAGAAGPAVYIGLEQLTQLNQLVAGAVAAAGPTASTLFRATVERGDRRRDLRSHELFFLYEAGRRADTSGRR